MCSTSVSITPIARAVEFIDQALTASDISSSLIADTAVRQQIFGCDTSAASPHE